MSLFCTCMGPWRVGSILEVVRGPNKSDELQTGSQANSTLLAALITSCLALTGLTA